MGGKISSSSMAALRCAGALTANGTRSVAAHHGLGCDHALRFPLAELLWTLGRAARWRTHRPVGVATRIDTVAARDKLKTRRGPYWHRLSKGCHVGFRKMTATGHGSWLARARDEEAWVQHLYKPLGEFLELADHLRFDAAAKAAQQEKQQSYAGLRVVNLVAGTKVDFQFGDRVSQIPHMVAAVNLVSAWGVCL
jgi:hypothetical protein